MKIAKNTVVTVNYKLSDAQENLIEDGREPMVYLHGGYENIFPKVEAALNGQAVGFAVKLDLSAEEAFGERDESLVRVIPKAEFPPGVKVGGQLRGRSAEGHEQVFNVVKIKGDKVILDANHPWAGQHLTLSLTVQEVRAASEEEVTHRHAHGAHGHHH